MPHQCLKCGSCYEQGSAEILRGCGSCAGTRFFYTETPLAPPEREALLSKSNRDLRSLVEEAARAQTKGAKLAGKGDWVALGPGYLRNLVEGVVGERPGTGPSISEYVRGLGAPRPAATTAAATHPDLGIDFIDMDEGAPGAPSGRAPEPPVSAHEAAPPAPPVSTGAPPAGASAPSAPSHEGSAAPRVSPPPARPPAAPGPPAGEAPVVDLPPESLRVTRDGRYEIDLKGLLEDHPIIVNKDGTYLIHLPSVFEGVERGKRWKR